MAIPGCQRESTQAVIAEVAGVLVTGNYLK